MELNTDPIVIGWTLAAISGLYPAYFNVRHQVRELAALRKRKVNHGAQFVASGYVIVEGIVLSISFACVYVGLAALFTEPDPNPPPRNLAQFSIAWVLFYIGLAVSVRNWIVMYVKKNWFHYAKAVSGGE